jgi:hypothetical protein
MHKIPLVFVAALSLATFGCKKKGGGDCDKAIAKSMDVSKADMQKMGVDDKMMAKMSELGIKHCKDDKWSDDAIACMTNAKSETEAQGCYDKLTADQRDKMNKAAMEMAPTPTTPPPATGSAMGSDTTGSAAAGSDLAGSGSGTTMTGSGSGSAGSATP